jgi:hypothetical protein
MAIDQEIARRVDSYRGNPQALQQRYAGNKELLDLLALQRLKSEKDQAAQKVALEMQQNPATIKQQREQQLLSMTQQDLAKQTQGIKDLAQKQQQKNVQRVAKQGAASPQDMQRVATGLGQLAQSQGGPAPRMMAGGGIVAFQEGGDVSAKLKDIETQIRQLQKRTDLAPSTRQEKLNELKKEQAELYKKLAGSGISAPRILADENREKSAGNKQPFSNLIPDLVLSGVETGEKTVERLKQEEAPTDIAEALRADAGKPPLTSADIAAALQQPLREQLPPPEQPPQGQALSSGVAPQGGIGDLGSLSADFVSPEKIGVDADAVKNVYGENYASIDPKAEGMAARNEAAAFLGRGEKDAEMRRGLEGLRKLYEARQDPETLRNERISAFLRGAGGRSGFGGVMSGASGAMARTAAQQSQLEEQRAKDLYDRLGDIQNRDTALGQDALTRGENVFNQLSMDKQNILTTLSNATTATRDRALEVAENIYNSKQDAIANRLKKLEIDAQNAYTEAIKSNDREAKLAAIAADIMEAQTNTFKSLVGNDTSLRALNIGLQNALDAGDEEKAIAIEEAIQEKIDQHKITATALINKANLLSLIDQIKIALDGGTPATPATSDIDMSRFGDLEVFPK